MRTQEADIILAHAGMKIKSWVFSGDEASSMEIGDIDDNLPLGEKLVWKECLEWYGILSKTCLDFKLRSTCSL